MSRCPVSHPQKIHRPQAFTLVELLVALSVSALLIVMLTNVMSGSLKVSKRSSETMTTFGSANAALDMIATDLESLATTREAFVYLQALPDPDNPIKGTQPMRLLINVISPQNLTLTTGSTNYPESAQVCAVAYRILWRNPVIGTVDPANANSNIFGLYRTAATPQNTFQNALGQTDLYNGFWKNQAVPAVNDFFAGQIIDLKISFYVAGNASPVNVSAGAYQPVQISGNAASVNGAAFTTGPITSAEISLTVLDEAGAKLWGDGSGVGELSSASLRQKYGHTLTRKVVLVVPL